MDKKLTRKQFLAWAGSLIGLALLSRIPSTEHSSTNTYGTGTYGGRSKA